MGRVNATTRLLHPRERGPVPMVQKLQWASGPVRTGRENLAPNGIRTANHPTPSKLLYRLCHNDHTHWITKAIHTLRIYTTYCFSAATTVTLTRIFVALYIHRPSCYNKHAFSIGSISFWTQSMLPCFPYLYSLPLSTAINQGGKKNTVP
jgi:hypothetical protein